jgi:hypothetical protein
MVEPEPEPEPEPVVDVEAHTDDVDAESSPATDVDAWGTTYRPTRFGGVDFMVGNGISRYTRGPEMRRTCPLAPCFPSRSDWGVSLCLLQPSSAVKHPPAVRGLYGLRPESEQATAGHADAEEG